MPGRDRRVKRSDESFKDLSEVLREWIRDLRRTRSLLVQSTRHKLYRFDVQHVFPARAFRWGA
jgi:hypothetical protein